MRLVSCRGARSGGAHQARELDLAAAHVVPVPVLFALYLPALTGPASAEFLGFDEPQFTELKNGSVVLSLRNDGGGASNRRGPCVV